MSDRDAINRAWRDHVVFGISSSEPYEPNLEEQRNALNSEFAMLDVELDQVRDAQTEAGATQEQIGDRVTAVETRSLDNAASIEALNALASGDAFQRPNVDVVTIVNAALATGFQPGSTHNGVVLADGMHILINGQTNRAENGPYTVQASGAPVRRGDGDTVDELQNSLIKVTGGDVGKGHTFRCAEITGALGTADIEFIDLGAGFFSWKGQWTDGDDYLPGDAAGNVRGLWQVTAAHTASPLSEPGIGADYLDYWEVIIPNANENAVATLAKLYEQGEIYLYDQVSWSEDAAPVDLVVEGAFTVTPRGGVFSGFGNRITTPGGTPDFNAVEISRIDRQAQADPADNWTHINVEVKSTDKDGTLIAEGKVRVGEGLLQVSTIRVPLVAPSTSTPVTLDAADLGATYFVGYFATKADGSKAAIDHTQSSVNGFTAGFYYHNSLDAWAGTGTLASSPIRCLLVSGVSSKQAAALRDDVAVDPTPALRVAPYYPALEGQLVTLDLDSFVPGGVADSGTSLRISGVPENATNATDVVQAGSVVEFRPTAAFPLPRALSVRKDQRPFQEREIAASEVLFKTNAQMAGTAASIIMIGDSLVDSGQLALHTKKAIEATGGALTLLGSRSDVLVDGYNNGADITVNHFGCSGAEWSNLRDDPSWTSANTGETFTNNWYDGGDWDYATGLAALGNPSNDALYMGLGTNGDLYSALNSTQLGSAIEEILDGYAHAIANTHASHSAVKFIVPELYMPPQHNPQYKTNPTMEQRRWQVQSLNHELRKLYAGREADNIIFATLGSAINTWTDYPYEGFHGTLTFTAAGNSVSTGDPVTGTVADKDRLTSYYDWSVLELDEEVEFAGLFGPLRNRGRFTIDSWIYASGAATTPGNRIGAVLRGGTVVDEANIYDAQVIKLPHRVADVAHPHGRGFYKAGLRLAATLACAGVVA